MADVPAASTRSNRPAHAVPGDHYSPPLATTPVTYGTSRALGRSAARRRSGWLARLLVAGVAIGVVGVLASQWPQVRRAVRRRAS